MPWQSGGHAQPLRNPTLSAMHGASCMRHSRCRRLLLQLQTDAKLDVALPMAPADPTAASLKNAHAGSPDTRGLGRSPLCTTLVAMLWL